MALYNGVDPVSFVSNGVFSETYGSADGENIAALFVSYGLIEEAPAPVEGGVISKILQIGKTGVRLATGFFHIGG